MTSRYTPTPVFEDIFKILPVKSLLRFRAVSKLWNTIITEPLFILTHMECSSDINPRLLVQEVYANVQRFSLKKVVDDQLDEHMSVVFGSPSNVLVGACGGLLCVKKTDNPYRFAILNPSLKRVINLPLPNHAMCRLHFLSKSVFGFGFDAISDDFKIVRIEYSNILFAKFKFVEVFSLKNMEWRSIRYRPASSRFQSENTLLRGNLHWIAKQDKRLVMEVFDLDGEKFYTSSLPECLSTAPLSSISMTSKGRSILLLQKTRWELWVMKEYGDENSWTKFYSIELNYMEEYSAFGDRRVTWTQDGQIILKLGDGLLLLLHDDGEVQQIQHDLVSTDGNIIRFKHIVDNYTESLMLLNSDGFFMRNLSNGWVELSFNFRGMSRFS